MEQLTSRKLLDTSGPDLPRGPDDASKAGAAAVADAVSFGATSLALTAFIFILALFFFGCFSIYVRRIFFSTSRSSSPSSSSLNSDLARPSPSTRPPTERGRWMGMFMPARGLDPSLVRELPVLCYVGGGDGGEGGGKEGCVVCLEEFRAKEQVKVLPRCGHAFHPTCIDAWLTSRGTCPICRCSDIFNASRSSISGSFTQRPVASTEEIDLEEERRQEENIMDDFAWKAPFITPQVPQTASIDEKTQSILNVPETSEIIAVLDRMDLGCLIH